MAVSPVQVAERQRGERWLSLGPASRILGVDPDTLRRWADMGRIGVYLTPGGHRRFAKAEIERLASAGRGAPRTLASLGATAERLRRVYARTYRRSPGSLPRPG